MPDLRLSSPGVEIAPIKSRSVVLLTVWRQRAEEARRRLRLAAPARFTEAEPRGLWLAPDRWLLLSDRLEPRAIIDQIGDRLDGIAHLAVDRGAALLGLRLAGPAARALLSSGTGLDLTPAKFTAGACARTRLAGIRVIIVAAGPDELELYLERGFGAYFRAWLTDAMAPGAGPISPDAARPGSR